MPVSFTHRTNSRSTNFSSPMKTVVLAVALCFASAPIFAQSPAAPAFRVSKVTVNMARTPTTGDYPGKRSRNTSFIEVETIFEDLAPLSASKMAASDLTLNYYVVLKTKGLIDPTDRAQRMKEDTMLTGSVSLVNVPHDKELKSVMYITPRTLERFFEGKIPASAQAAVVDAAVTISRDGQVVGQGAASSDVSKNEWWKGLQPVSGFLRNKNETPFSHLAWDYYEEIKPSGEGAK